MSVERAPSAAEVERALRDEIGAGVMASEAVRSRFSYDFGRHPEAAPLAVVRARSERDVSRVLALCSQMGVRVRVRGAGHSCGGQTLAPGGVVLLNQRDDGEVIVDAHGRVEVDARLTWNALDARLGALGLAPPVLTDYLDLTVGGTLSVGGYGLRSVSRGAQYDHVDRLKLVLADGSARWCARDESPELFELALAGLGAAGVIERVVMRTIPRPKSARLVRFAHRDLEDLARSMAWADEAPRDEPLLFSAFWMKGRIFSEYGSEDERVEVPIPAALRAREPAHREDVAEHSLHVHASRTRWLAQYARSRALWTDWFFDHDGLRAFVTFLDRRLHRAEYARYLGTCYFLVCRREASEWRPPLSADALRRGGAAFGVGTYFFVPVGDRAGEVLVRDELRALRDRALELGGRPYRYGCDELDRSALTHLYGDALHRAEALRNTLDPRGVLRRDHGPNARINTSEVSSAISAVSSPPSRNTVARAENFSGASRAKGRST